jgi:hypothetical protein
LLPPVGWVDVHPEITPPSNFHQLRDTTDKRSAKLLRLSKKVDGQLEDFLIQYAEARVYQDIQSWHDGMLQNDDLRE